MIFGPYLSSVLRLLLPSEHCADLAVAEASLEGKDTRAALLALGKVLLCAGKVKRAREVLSRAETAPGDADEVALAGAYRRLADLADFGACREWGPGKMPLELARSWSLSKWAIDRDSWSRRLPALSAAVEQEVWFITQIAPLPNEFPSASSPDEARPLWARLVRSLERVSREEFREEIVTGTSIVNALILRLADRRTDAWQTITRALGLCRTNSASLSAGLFALLADDLATTSRTVPEVMDLYAGDAVHLNRNTLEALEEGPLPNPPSDWRTVFEGQSPARTIFERLGWPLGIAAAQVHAASWITRAKPPDVPASFEIQQLVEAQSAFECAADEAGKRLVRCRLLATVVEQNYSYDEHFLQMAHEIGVWGRTVGSVSFALGLGLFLLAVARWWRRRGDLACALRALKLADALFDGLEAPVAKADAAVEEADLLAADWESSQAVPSLQRALDRYIEAITAMGVPQPGSLDTWRRLRMRVAETGTAVLASCAGQEAFARTRQRLVELNVLPGMTL